MATAAPRSATRSLAKMLEMLLRTVFSDSPRAAAIATFELAVGQVIEHVTLAGGELGERVCLTLATRGEEVAHPARQGGPEDDLALGHGGDRAKDVVRRGALEDVAARPGPHRGEDGRVVLEHGEHQHRGPRQARGQGAGRLDAARAAQVDVHQDDVGHDVLTDRDGGPGVGRLAGQLQPLGLLHHGAQPGPEHRVVVDHDDGDQLGSHARTTVPPLRPGSISHLPPSSAARSRIEVIPTPAR